MTAIKTIAVLLAASMVLAACSSKPPPRGRLPQDRNAVDRMSNAYVRAVQMHNAGDCAGASKLLYRVAVQGSGYEDAQRRLGECTIVLAGSDRTKYMDGIVWLRRAAEAGWPEAQGALAYEYAAGIMADPVEAAKWLTLYDKNPKTKRLGFTPTSPEKLTRARLKITPEQWEKGREAAASFVPVVWVPPASVKRDAATDLKEGEDEKSAPRSRRGSDEDRDRPIGGEFPQPGQ